MPRKAANAKPKPPGRPPLLTPAVTQQVCELVAGGVPLSHACLAAGLHAKAGYEWSAKAETHGGEYAAFADALKKARAEAVVLAVKGIIAAGPKNWQCYAWWLERQYPKDFGGDKFTVKVLRAEIERLKAVSGQSLTAEAVDDHIAGVMARRVAAGKPALPPLATPPPAPAAPPAPKG